MNDTAGATTPTLLLQMYVEGCKTLDVRLLRNCFHATAVMNGFMGRQLYLGQPDPFFDDVTDLQLRAIDNSRSTYEIKSVQKFGNIASAVVITEYFASQHNFIDLMHMIFEADRWWIISKTFTTREEP